MPNIPKSLREGDQLDILGNYSGRASSTHAKSNNNALAIKTAYSKMDLENIFYLTGPYENFPKFS